MEPKKLIILVTDNSSTMSREDWERLYNSTAGTADNRIHIPAPAVDLIHRQEKQEKDYWKPKYERFKKKHNQ